MTAHPRTLLLASGSPRRRALLGLLGLPFHVTQVDIDETPRPDEDAAAYTIRLSQEKARAVLSSAEDSLLILAADTTVADGTLILGKPSTPEEAWAMLRRLRGRTHQVYTALTVLDPASGHSLTELACTDVPMRPYTDAEIEAYVASGDPFDKAGGYAIQHTGFSPVMGLTGCYANVVGLPLCHLVRMLRALGVEAAPDVPLRCQDHHAYLCPVAGDILAGRR